MVVKLNRLLDWAYVVALVVLVMYILWYVVIVFFFTSFIVPTTSMTPTLQPGDRLLVSKIEYGPRLWNLMDSVRHGSVVRLWGYGKPRRNDVMVFNAPYPDFGKHVSFDGVKYFVKRCVALPGDTFEIHKCIYSVRGSEDTLGYYPAQRRVQSLTKDSAQVAALGRMFGAFPKRRFIPWTIREMGPFYIPKKGDTIRIDRDNMLLYGALVEWEVGSQIENRGDTLFLVNGKPIRQHVMEQNCYFMAGDNAPESVDSRYWGLVLEEFIVGRVARVLWSHDTLTGNFVWARFYKKVE